MKKIIILEILLTVVFVALLVCAIIAFRYIAAMKEYIDYAATIDPDYPDYTIIHFTAHDMSFFSKLLLGLAIPMIIAASFVLTVMVIIAVKDLPIVKQRISEFKVRYAARKEHRAEAKEEKAEADKKARIEALQAELDELKKDE